MRDGSRGDGWTEGEMDQRIQSNKTDKRRDGPCVDGWTKGEMDKIILYKRNRQKARWASWRRLDERRDGPNNVVWTKQTNRRDGSRGDGWTKGEMDQRMKSKQNRQKA